MSKDFLADLGYLSFVTRLKRLSDKMLHDGRRMYRDLGMDIEPNWYAVFKLLGKEGPLPVTDIAERIGFSHPSVVSIVNKMCKAGYLEAGSSDGDNRKRFMKLSGLAVKRLPEFEKVWAAGVTTMKQMVPEADALHIISLLERKTSEKGFRERTLEAYRQNAAVKIETFRSEYAPDFARLNYEWIEAAYEIEDCDREILDHPLDYVIKRGGQIFFAFAGSEAVGTVALVPEEEGVVELAKMAVNGEYRGYGIGDALMRAFVSYSREQGIDKIVLDSNRKQVPAINLYKKYGFREVPMRPDTPYARSDIRMELELGQSAAGEHATDIKN